MAEEDIQPTRIGATASPEKWIVHAQQKLKKGYELVIPQGKKAAYLQKRGKEEEPCPYKVARKIITMGLVEVTYEDEDDTIYKLVGGVEVAPPVVVVDEDDDEESDDFVSEDAIAVDDDDSLADLDDDEEEEVAFRDDDDFALSGEADDDD
jgi:hypothetical protein